MGLLDRWRREPEPPPGPLADLAAAPLLPRDTPLEEVELLAIDLETSGLDPRRDELLSFGYVPVHAGEVLLAGASHHGVRPRGEVGDSANVHRLTDDLLAQAAPLQEVLPRVLEAFVGQGGRRRVLLAHFSQVEGTFLAAACREVYGTSVPLQVVDTLEVQRRLIGVQHHELRPGTLRLHRCRRAHGLPAYAAHHALLDAVACAELFLAQCTALEARRRRPLTLDDVAERQPRSVR